MTCASKVGFSKLLCNMFTKQNQDNRILYPFYQKVSYNSVYIYNSFLHDRFLWPVLLILLKRLCQRNHNIQALLNRYSLFHLFRYLTLKSAAVILRRLYGVIRRIQPLGQNVSKDFLCSSQYVPVGHLGCFH